MGLTLYMGGLPITVPESTLDKLQTKLEAKARGEVGKMIPTAPIIRQSLKGLLIVGMPYIRAWLDKHAKGYPLPDPPRHGDLLAYMTDYGVEFGLTQLAGLRAAICSVPWEVQVVETGAGVQVAGFAALGTSDSRALAAPGDGARGGDASGASGASTPAA